MRNTIFLYGDSSLPWNIFYIHILHFNQTDLDYNKNVLRHVTCLLFQDQIIVSTIDFPNRKNTQVNSFNMPQPWMQITSLRCATGCLTMTRNKYEAEAKEMTADHGKKKEKRKDLCGRQEMKRGRMSEMKIWQMTEVKDEPIKMQVLIGLTYQKDEHKRRQVKSYTSCWKDLFVSGDVWLNLTRS